jgi:NAD-dependent SIR2 family protein deacetylase
MGFFVMHANLNHNRHHDSSKCEFCRNFHEFELPESLIEELLSNNVVLFAGAGISTEDRNVFPYTLYEDIRRELKVLESEIVSFSDLMTLYCRQPNGRAKLLRKIRERFEYIRSFPELYRVATRFHLELSTFFFIQSIITTNWDDYFERECGAIPYVIPEDFTFWSVPGRKVFKIHGSISNLGSIVATTKDFKKCYKQLEKRLLGSSLKEMLATKTVLYVGYSFRDEDFIKIYSMLCKEMGQLMPHGFIVTLDKKGEKKYRELGLTPIFTDATYFISVLKNHAVQNKHMLPDEVFEEVLRELEAVQEAHQKLWNEFNIIENPDIIYAASYQDGLIHAFERILAIKNSGYYSDRFNITRTIYGYKELRRAKLSARKYFDIAYIDGYINGLLYLVFDSETREDLPLYYIFGRKDQPVTFNEYIELRRNAFDCHKSAYKYAMHIVQEKGYNKKIIFHHPPFLL